MSWALNRSGIKKRFPTVLSVGNVVRIHNDLFSESEFFDQLTVALEVVLAQVGEQAFSFTHHFHQAAMSGEIFFVGLQVQGDLVDPFCQQGNLALNRAGVGGGAAKICEVTRFFLFCQIRHLKICLSISAELAGGKIKVNI
jgi:hypothetical protein